MSAAFVAHGGVSHGPSAIDLPHHVRRGNHNIREKDLVEVGSPRDLAQRTNLDPWGVHVDEEVGDALVLGDVGVRPSDQNPPITVLGTRCPDLLAVHDEGFSVTFGAALQPCEIGSGIWF